jgi:hypothetical protein
MMQVAASLHQVSICQQINAAPATHERIQKMMGMRCVRSADCRKHEIKRRREKLPRRRSLVRSIVAWDQS